jgi:hypothetical protein
MIGTRPERLSFTPTLACVDCQRATNQGLIYQMSSQVWQLLPLCNDHIEEPPASAESAPLGELRYRINEHLTRIQQLQRQRSHLERAYVSLRRQHAPLALRRAPRRQLNQADKLQAEGMEVLP